MRRSNCSGAMQYVPELTWILFLRILDERKIKEAEMAEAVQSQKHTRPVSSFVMAPPHFGQGRDLSQGTTRRPRQRGQR